MKTEFCDTNAKFLMHYGTISQWRKCTKIFDWYLKCKHTFKRGQIFSSREVLSLKLFSNINIFRQRMPKGERGAAAESDPETTVVVNGCHLDQTIDLF